MIPIQQLLRRIQFDAEFGHGEFELGIFDRAQQDIIRVSLRDVSFPAGTRGMFHFVDSEGRSHQVPFHRIRQVFKDGGRIWNRPEPHGVRGEPSQPK